MPARCLRDLRVEEIRRDVPHPHRTCNSTSPGGSCLARGASAHSPNVRVCSPISGYHCVPPTPWRHEVVAPKQTLFTGLD